MIVHAVDLTFPRRTRGGGHDARKRRIFRDEPIAQRALARTGGTGEHEENGRLDQGLSHTKLNGRRDDFHVVLLANIQSDGTEADPPRSTMSPA
jgi:hypothetical protein